MPLTCAEAGDGCRSPSVGGDPIVVAGAGIVGILRRAIAGSVHHVTVETWASPHLCVKNIFSRDGDQLIIANCLPVRYAPGGAQPFPVLPSAKRDRHFYPCSVGLSKGVWPHRQFPRSPFGKPWPQSWRSTIAGAPSARRRRQRQDKKIDPAKQPAGGRAKLARLALHVETGHLFPVQETPL